MTLTNPDVLVVEEEYTFPFKLHQYQLNTIGDAAKFEKGVLFPSKVGEGKSVMSLYLGLYHSIRSGVRQILILMPPSIIDQWSDFIDEIKGIDEHLVYRGSPAQRKAMDLTAYPIVLMSYNIFRTDFNKVQRMGQKNKLFVIGDELSLKSMGQTYKKFKQLIYGRLRIDPVTAQPLHKFCALNATPVSDRGQVYLWTSIFDPWLYTSRAYFELCHVDKKDNWGNVLKWINTDDMDDKFDEICAISKNVDIEMPDTVFTEIPYTLEGEHKKLYDAIAAAEFEKLPVDAVGLMVESMFSTLQRVVLYPQEFGLDIVPPVVAVVKQLLGQMDEEDQVILYTRHVNVSKMLGDAFPAAVSYFGKITKAKKKENLRRFKHGEAEIMVANLDSLGKGQNLQVANRTVFVELPFRSDVMTQACGRTARQGQKKTCFFYIPIAKGTIQAQIYKNLLTNDFDLRRFNRNKKTLKEFLFDNK